MATIDSLPPDQRAVLQLVLQRGRSYDEIADMLSIDRAAVRQRALDALDALTPAGTGSAAAERSLITDYLLRQLPSGVAAQVHALLETSEPDNAWAHGVAAELSQFSGTLAEIPELRSAESGPPTPEVTAEAPAERAPLAEREPDAPKPNAVPIPHEHSEEPGPDARDDEGGELWLDDDEPTATVASSYERPARERPAGSRRAGAMLLGAVGTIAVIVIVLLVAGVFSGGSNPQPAASGHSPRTGSNASSQDSSSGNTAKYLSQINLSAPGGSKTPAGVVQVVEEHLAAYKSKGKLIPARTVKGIVVLATGMTPNTKHNAYAVWLSNPGGSSTFLGFDHNLVGQNGKLQTEGALPANATDYKQILITLETVPKPTKPGTVVLSGKFTETSAGQ
jgi:hypothetical protein